MRYTRHLIMVLVISCVFHAAVGCHTPAMSEQEMQLWIEDISYIEHSLPDHHPNLFFKISAKEWQQQFNGLIDDLPRLSDLQVRLRLKEILVSIGDSHTFLMSLPEPEDNQLQVIFPIALTKFPEGLYIVSADEAIAQETLGKKLVNINGYAVDEVWQRILPIVPAANVFHANWLVPLWMRSPITLRGLGIADDEEVIFTLMDETGGDLKITLQPLDRKQISWRHLLEGEERPLWLRKSEAFWYEHYPESKLLYFQYNSCRHTKDPSFGGFADKLMQDVREYDIEKLVIDLRRNRGGEFSIAEAFFSDLARIEDINQVGRLFVLVSNTTYSAAVWHAVQLKGQTEALFIGEPTGSEPDCFAHAIESLITPNLNLTVIYSTKFFEMSTEYGLPELKGVDTFHPDVLIPLTFADYIRGRDPVLEAVMSYPSCGQ